MTAAELAQQAQANASAHVSGYGQAVAVIGGKKVVCDVIPGCRNAGARRKASLRWSVDGKAVAASKLSAVLAA